MSERLAQEHENETGSLEKVSIGSYVELRFADDEMLYIHLYEQRPEGGETESKYEAVSANSPIGKAIMQHVVGDVIAYKTPKHGVLTLEVCAITSEAS